MILNEIASQSIDLITLFSCKQTVKEKQAAAVVFKDTIPSTYDSVFKINSMMLKTQMLKERERVYSLKSLDGKIIIQPADYYANLEILDINKDGFNDIRIFVVSNTPNQCENYFLFQKRRGSSKLKTVI